MTNHKQVLARCEQLEVSHSLSASICGAVGRGTKCAHVVNVAPVLSAV